MVWFGVWFGVGLITFFLGKPEHDDVMHIILSYIPI